MKPYIEEIVTHFYRAEIPIPDSPLKATNCYIIKSDDRNLIIDTGMNEKECLDTMKTVLLDLGIQLPDTDFFITHSHRDHIGLINALASKSSRVFYNIKELGNTAAAIRERATRAAIIAQRHGYENNRIVQMVETGTAPEKMDVYPEFSRYTIVRESDTLTVSGYSFKVIETPGHSPGHTCLYDKNKKIFISGDHILGDITPNIASHFNNDENPLQDYLASLDKVYPLDVKLTLPGHRNLITDFRGRIAELKSHHAERAAETLEILKEGSLDAFQVASRMTWDLSYNTWEDIPFSLKWFAFSEAMSHLQYLESLGKVKQIAGQDGKILFTLSD